MSNVTTIAMKLLQEFIGKKKELCIAVTHVQFASEVHSQNIIDAMEDLTRDLNLLWAISRPQIPLSYLHVLYAFYHTLKAFALNKNISSKFNIEFLLRLTCEDQIVKALKIAGLSEKTKSFCLYSISLDSMTLKTLLSRLTSLFNELMVSSESCCYGNDLLTKLNVRSEELTSTSYHSSVLDPELKSILTRMSLLNIKKR